MKKIYNDYIPFKGFIAMLWLWWLFVRNDLKHKLTEKVERHESVHSYQQVCIFIADIILVSVLAIFTNVSWYWLVLSAFSPLILYVICWIIEILLPPYNRAYKDICFESEAKYLEDDPNWKKKVFPFSFILYVPNKDYGKSINKKK